MSGSPSTEPEASTYLRRDKWGNSSACVDNKQEPSDCAAAKMTSSVVKDAKGTNSSRFVFNQELMTFKRGTHGGVLLWLLGVPLSLIILLYMFF